MAKMGRPQIIIDKEQFESLCNLQCTLIEIAGFFTCSEDTIENWCKRTYGETFSEVFKKKSTKGKISVRRKQFQVAQGGNVSMLIWLGKQWLGQAEVQSINVNNTDDETIKEMKRYFENK